MKRVMREVLPTVRETILEKNRERETEHISRTTLLAQEDESVRFVSISTNGDILLEPT